MPVYSEEGDTGCQGDCKEVVAMETREENMSKLALKWTLLV